MARNCRRRRGWPQPRRRRRPRAGMADEDVQPMDAEAEAPAPAADEPAPEADAAASEPPPEPGTPGGGADWEERAMELQSKVEDLEGEMTKLKEKLEAYIKSEVTKKPLILFDTSPNDGFNIDC